jgi:hypothetical protein
VEIRRIVGETVGAYDTPSQDTLVHDIGIS